MATPIPRLPYNVPMINVTYGYPEQAFQQWWLEVALNLESQLTDIEDALADIVELQTQMQEQIDALVALNSDDVLTPAKKPMWIFMESVLTGEQAGIDAEATSYGIGAPKTAYDNAVSALTTYLATLTTPVLWDDLTGNTDIVGVTFRANFDSVMSTKQTLLNAIAAAAKVLADAAAADAAAADAAAAAAAADAAAADAAAAAAQADADEVIKNDKISASATEPSVVISAADVGSDCTITIAAHTRRYGDGTTLAVSGGSITGLAFSTTYAVYYDDPTTADTTPTYVATTTLKNAQPNSASGRHYVDQVTTPADGGGSSSGGGYLPPGGGGPYP